MFNTTPHIRHTCQFDLYSTAEQCTIKKSTSLCCKVGVLKCIPELYARLKICTVGDHIILINHLLNASESVPNIDFVISSCICAAQVTESVSINLIYIVNILRHSPRSFALAFGGTLKYTECWRLPAQPIHLCTSLVGSLVCQK